MFKRQIDGELAGQSPFDIDGVRLLTDHSRQRSIDLIPHAVDPDRVDSN